MSTKIAIVVLALFVAGTILFACISNAQVQESINIEPVAIPSADSSTKKVVDSTKTIRDEFVSQKESLKDKVNYLQYQQKLIRETQKQIDSFTHAGVVSFVYP